MLVIISDLHLGDGTTADSISPSAFRLFARRLTETARFASLRRDGGYRPISSLDVLLLGDILDPLHSARWLDTSSSDSNYVRPWSDPATPSYAAKLLEVTRESLGQAMILLVIKAQLHGRVSILAFLALALNHTVRTGEDDGPEKSYREGSLG